ncbi:MAG TPA: hypothetical protein VH482_27380 [Thermomicrobiales bacterium]|jgi:hypothetical protein
MDGERFDHTIRMLATGLSRRRTLSLLIGAVAGAAGLPVADRAEAKPNCGGLPCGHACCKGTCCQDADDVCTDAGKCCPAIQTCGEHCCPPDNVGCTETQLPDGTIKIGCLCPGGKFLYRGKCLPCHKDHKTCTSDVQCCSGSCCNGHCCPAGQFCGDNGTCVCESDELTCGDTCCPKDHVCQDGKCACKKDQLDCGSYCVPKEVQGFEGAWPGCCTAKDCPTKAVCHDHTCLECGLGTGLHCPAGQTCCTGHCVKLNSGDCDCFGPCQTGWTCEPGGSSDAPGTCCTKDGDSTICKGHPGT